MRISCKTEGTFSPFIKWVGGKRQLLAALKDNLPSDGFNDYYEPFIGGGALLLALAPKRAYINDFNPELVSAWQTVRNDPSGLFLELKKHQSSNSKDYYLSVRGLDRSPEFATLTTVQRAARFIYLNKTGFNGLWRVNSKGQNNVPFSGREKINLLSYDYTKLSAYLKKSVTVSNEDYQKAVRSAKPGDLVYFDPPYIPISPTASFTSYTTSQFALKEQKDLAELAVALSDKGVKVMVSNSDVPLISDLYPAPQFTVHHVSAKRMVNANGKKRGAVGEVIVTNY